MKKEILVTTAAFLLIATPAFAKSDNANNGQGNDHQSDKAQEVLATHDNNGQNNEDHGKPTTPTNTPIVAAEVNDDLSITPSITVTLTPTTSEKEHGLSTTQTCDPNAVWKNHGAYVSCVAHTHQGGAVTSEAARSDIGKKHQPTPSVSPSASPTATLTPTLTPPITSAANELSFNSFLDIPGLLKRIAKFFTHFRV